MDRATDWPTSRGDTSACPPPSECHEALFRPRSGLGSRLGCEPSTVAGPGGRQFAGVGLDGARLLRLRPHWSVKTTRGVVSQFCGPPSHMAAGAYPPRPQRPAATRPARPLPDGPHRPWRERPPSPRARCGIAPRVFSHPRPLPSKGRSRANHPCGKAVQTPLCDTADQPILLRLVPPLPKRLAPSPPPRARTRSRWPRPPRRPWPPTPRSSPATTQPVRLGFAADPWRPPQLRGTVTVKSASR